MATTYRDAGVDIEAGDAFVDSLGPIVRRTRREEVLSGIGGFGGLFQVPSGYTDPVLVAGTDGVGTKLKVAFRANRHHTVGIDLVAMCVNDIVCAGAEPLFFLDYFGTGRLDGGQGRQVVEGIVEGCVQAGCALLGGETAELPGFYAKGEYDLAGFAVGVVERDAILDSSAVCPGDVLIGLASSGLHSNGYSLARKVLLEGPDADRWLDPMLTPTRIYVSAVLAAVRAGGVRAAAHITGGGIGGNLVRVLPEGVSATVDPQCWERLPIFDAIQTGGDVQEEEMRRAFNLGLGMILIVEPDAVEGVMDAVRAAGEEPMRVGHVESGERAVRWIEGSG